MNCPACRVPLVEGKWGGHCTLCGGLWTDAERLSILHDGGPPPELLQATAFSPDRPSSERVCPRCRFPLTPAEFRWSSVEVCRICAGIWVERVVFVKLTLDW